MEGFLKGRVYLEALNINECGKITNVTMQRLSQHNRSIMTLQMEDTQVNDEAIVHIQQLANLCIIATKGSISKKGRQKLQTLLPKTTIVLPEPEPHSMQQ
jgi:glutamate formiminotransferase